MTNPPAENNGHHLLQVRLYLSAPGPALSAVRTEIARRVLPLLRRKFARRGMSLVLVDPCAEGDPAPDLPLADRLDEIARCRPFFLGILGPGGGDPAPREVHAALAARHPWLGRFRHRTIGEIEAECAILQAPPGGGGTLFYALGSHPPATAATTALTGREPSQDLPTRLREAGLPFRDGLASPSALGDQVYGDLLRLLEEVAPRLDPGPLHHAGLLQEAFAEARRGCYLANPALFQRLDDFVEHGGDHPLLVTGPLGRGKSALVANWVAHHRRRHPDDLVLTHSFEVSAEAATETFLYRRLLHTLEHRFDLPLSPPLTEESLRQGILEWLYLAVPWGRTVLVLDGVDLWKGEREGTTPEWLTAPLPPGLRLIITGQTDHPLVADLVHRGCTVVTLPPLDRPDRQTLLQMSAEARGLTDLPPRLERLLPEPPCADPLFLNLLLDTLDIFPPAPGDAPRLPLDVSPAYGPADLLDLVLARLDETCLADRPWACRDALTALASSRAGLAEEELLSLLGNGEDPLPTPLWTRLRRHLDPLLLQTPGRWTLAHQAVAEAVTRRYLFSEQHVFAQRERLVTLFRPVDRGPRHLQEYGWQLAAQRSWETLARWLSAPDTFSELVLADHIEATRLWRLLERHSPFRSLEAYARPLLEPERHLAFLPALAAFLRESGLREKALDLDRRFVQYLRGRPIGEESLPALDDLAQNLFRAGDFAEAEPLLLELETRFQATRNWRGLAGCRHHLAIIAHSRGETERAGQLFRDAMRLFSEGGDGFGLERCLGSLGTALYGQGDLPGALATFRRQELVGRSLGRQEGLAAALLGQAMCHRAAGDLDQALTMLAAVETLCRELGSRRTLGTCLNLQAAVHRTRGDLSGAMARFQEAEALFGERQELAGLQVSLGGQASIHRSRGHLDEAARLFGEQERICRMIGSREGLTIALGGQAAILRERGRLADAMEMTRQAEKLCRDLCFREGLQRSLCLQANILRDQGDLDGALALLRDAERICREIGLKSGLQRTLEHLAMVLKARGDLDGALALLKEQERLCRQLGLKMGLQASMGHQAHILYFRGDVEGAMTLFRDQERICRDLGLRDRLQQALGGQAVIFRARGDWTRALLLLEEQEKICLEMGLKDGLQISLYNQGIIRLVRGDLDGAMTMFKKQEAICRQAGYREGLQASFGSQAVIHRNRGDMLRAMALFQEQEKICRESGYKEGLQVSLCGQAAILQASGDFDIAMAKLREGERICRELSHKEGLQRVLCSQSLILRARGDNTGAMALLKEVEKICRGLDYKSGLQRALEYQAAILQAQGDLDQAMALLKEQEAICRELGIKAGLQAAIGQQALLLEQRGDLDGALTLLKEQELICRELGLKAGLARAMAMQAQVMARKFDRTREAMDLVNEAYKLARSHGLNTLSSQIQNVLNAVQPPGGIPRGRLEPGDWKRFQAQLAEKTAFARDPADPRASLERLHQQERLCRELDMPTELANSLAGQALIMRELGDGERALEVLRQEETIWRQQGSRTGLLECLVNQALLLVLDLHRPREALSLAEEAYRLGEKHDLPELPHTVLGQLLDFVHTQIK
ncbi:MAG: tetratricopeptide repeat protein [Candidatus Riflebacteria bacterium]|nr:tetratricopeptide repeat protein [Candidatus Riflebacteria bacterium]